MFEKKLYLRSVNQKIKNCKSCIRRSQMCSVFLGPTCCLRKHPKTNKGQRNQLAASAILQLMSCSFAICWDDRFEHVETRKSMVLLESQRKTAYLALSRNMFVASTWDSSNFTFHFSISPQIAAGFHFNELRYSTHFNTVHKLDQLVNLWIVWSHWLDRCLPRRGFLFSAPPPGPESPWHHRRLSTPTLWRSRPGGWSKKNPKKLWATVWINIELKPIIEIWIKSCFESYWKQY